MTSFNTAIMFLCSLLSAESTSVSDLAHLHKGFCAVQIIYTLPTFPQAIIFPRTFIKPISQHVLPSFYPITTWTIGPFGRRSFRVVHLADKRSACSSSMTSNSRDFSVSPVSWLRSFSKKLLTLDMVPPGGRLRIQTTSDAAQLLKKQNARFKHTSKQHAMWEHTREGYVEWVGEMVQ